MPVIFITDFLVFVMLFTVVIFIIYIRFYEPLRRPWQKVFQRPTAVIASIVLVIYTSIAVLDSIHFHPKIKTQKLEQTSYSPKIISLLDMYLTRLRVQQEKTYSAPLASYSYAKETVELQNGTKNHIYPRLLYGASHLKNPKKQWNKDIIKSILLASVSAFSLTGGLFLLTACWAAYYYRHRLTLQCGLLLTDAQGKAWYLVWLALFFLLWFACNIVFLADGYHILGTDKVGQDILYQVLKSVRTGFVIGTLTTLVMLPFAICAGLLAGYFGGWVDDIIQYLYTTLNSVPGVLLIAAGILMLQIYIANHPEDFTTLEQRADFRLLCLCFILGVTSWIGLCRLLRAEVLKLREIDYISAAKVLGEHHIRIIFRHLLPNVMHIIIITVVLNFSGLVLAEAVLSYINIGVDPSTYSWGNMINNARFELAREPIVWWPLAAALISMFIFVLAANLFSDAVRDAFDPRITSVDLK